MIRIFENVDCVAGCKNLPDKSVDCVITSPPYWQLRDYGYPEQWGLEPTFQEYLEHLWSLMDEIWRALKDTGTVWVNLGDTYNTISGNMKGGMQCKQINPNVKNSTINPEIYKKADDIKNKSLCLIPHRFAIGCENPKYVLRDDLTEEETNYVKSELLKCL